MKFLNIYLFLLAMVIGIEVSIGAFLAPVIFFPQNIIGEGVLTHFQSGQLMSNIFVKYNYVLLGVSAVSFIYEIINLKFDSSFYKKVSSFALSFIILVLALSFVFYFTEYILQAQKIGVEATQNEQFKQIHSASELVMKIMMIAQVILFFIKFPCLSCISKKR